MLGNGAFVHFRTNKNVLRISLIKQGKSNIAGKLLTVGECFCILKARVIAVPCAVQAVATAEAGMKLVDVPQPKPIHRFSPNFQSMFNPRGSRVD